MKIAFYVVYALHDCCVLYIIPIPMFLLCVFYMLV